MKDLQGVVAANELKAHKSPLRERVVSAVFWFGISKMLGQAISWVITIYVVRILSPDDYGLMTMTGTFTGFILLFNEIGLGPAIIQKQTISEEELSNLFWLIIFYNIFIYAALYLLAPLISVFYNEPRLVSIIRVVGLNFVISALGNIPFYMLTRNLSFGKRSMADFLGNLAGGVATLAFALNGYAVWSLVYGTLTMMAVTNICFYAFYPLRPAMRFSIKKIKGMFNFGLKISAARFFWYIYNNADNLIAGRLLGKTALGFYSLAFQFASIPIEKVVSLLTQIAFPTFSELQNDPLKLKKYFLSMVRFVAFITFPLFFGLFLVADDVVTMFLTEKWSPVILPLKILCVSSAFRAVNAMNTPLLVAKGKAGVATLSNFILALVMPCAFYIGSFYGLEGFSYSWLVFPFLFLITTQITLKAVGFPMGEYMNKLIHPILAVVLMTASVLALRESALYGQDRAARFLTSALASAVVYGLYYLIFNREMLEEAISIFKKGKRQRAEKAVS
ncbi:MAG: MOP flippase family protein [Deltaproteobacteria bacterium]|nr:MOP flippase family protein [Deltaproteobacteria bacterium]